MDFELSIQCEIQKNFCESSFIVAKAKKRRSRPSIKRIDFRLSKIRTTFNSKPTIKKTQLVFNPESSEDNSSYTKLNHSQNLKQNSTIFIKNSNKKIASSMINVILIFKSNLLFIYIFYSRKKFQK